jgi:hypothetical protein
MHRLIALALLLLSANSPAWAIDPREQQQQSAPTEPASSRPQPRPTPTPRTTTTPEAITEGIWLLEYGDTSAVYAEQRNVQRGARTTTIWTTWVHRNEQYGVKYAVRLMEFDCANRVHRTLTATGYDRRSRMVDDLGTSEAEHVVPGSIGEAIYRAACEPLVNWFDNAFLLRTDTDPIAYTDQLYSNMPK